MAITAELEKAAAPKIGSGDRLTRKDLQEAVESHGVWLDSFGEAGIRADFSGKNLEYADLVDTRLPDAFLHKTNLKGVDLTLTDLRGATLVQANLVEATLLGTQLQQSNLQAADMHGATGLLSSQLAGTNLFGAILPDSISPFEGLKLVREVAKQSRMADVPDVAAERAGVVENFHDAGFSAGEEFVGPAAFRRCKPLCRSFPSISSAPW